MSAFSVFRKRRPAPGILLLLAPVLSLFLVFLLFPAKSWAASSTSSVNGSANPSGTTQDDDPIEPYASQTGKFGLSVMFTYDILQTPAPVTLYQNSIGALGEISYGIARGIRILGGAGFGFGSPHVSPPLSDFGNSSHVSGPSINYVPVYLGVQLELTRWFPGLIRYQPWFPYIRGDSGGVFTSVSNDGPASLHTNGLMEDVGFGIEARPRAVPMAFFGEIRSQWLFLGPQIINVVPVLAGTTFYF
ncbi:MAG: hypothetical protein ACP5OP_02810 [Leptospirillia bacterium]